MTMSPALAGSLPAMPEQTPPLSGRDMVCFSHDWNGDPLSKTHLMRLLARDNRILWVNSIGYRAPTASKSDMSRALKKLAAFAGPIRNPEPNIFVLNPLIIPLHGRPWIREINRHLLRSQVKRAMRKLRFQKTINWTFNPAAAIIAGSINESTLIYYCVDEYSALAGVPSASIASLEERLMRRADLVVVSAQRLYESKKHLNTNTFIVRHGVNFEHFRKATLPETRVPDDIAHLPRPIIGYFGLISEDWVDLDLLRHTADRFPHASVVLLGKVAMDVTDLANRPNVHLLGRKPYSDLPAYSKGFDVALIPFPITEATLHSNPLKSREYLAAGLPVVSTAIPEVAVLGSCRIAEDRESFVQQIAQALRHPGPDQERSETMRSESWEARLEEVRAHFAHAVGNA